MAEGEVEVATRALRPRVKAKARWEAVAAVAMDLLEIDQMRREEGNKEEG